MTVLTPTASIWSVATRITALDSEGYPDPGNAMYVTEQKLKLDANQVTEALIGGDEPMCCFYKRLFQERLRSTNPLHQSSQMGAKRH